MYALLVRRRPSRARARHLGEDFISERPSTQYFLNSAWKEDFGHAFHTEIDFGFKIRWRARA